MLIFIGLKIILFSKLTSIILVKIMMNNLHHVNEKFYENGKMSNIFIFIYNVNIFFILKKKIL